MEEQPIPSSTKCPYCGGDPEYNPDHILSATGYTHDDIQLTCSECGDSWCCGVPIGEHDGELATDLFCESCEERYGLPHRVRPRNVPGTIVVHMKCPNCYYFWTFKRETDEGGTMLYGFPQTTGTIDEDTSAYGYPDEKKDDYVDE